MKLLAMLCGYDKTRPVPMWDEHGRRIGYVSPTAMAAPVRTRCEFCHGPFETVPSVGKQPRRTCSSGCAGLLRRRLKQVRAAERFKAARAARWLTFPKNDGLGNDKEDS